MHIEREEKYLESLDKSKLRQYGLDQNAHSQRLELLISFGGKNYDVEINRDATLFNLQEELEHLTGVPMENQKVMLPKRGLAKPELSQMLVSDLVPGVLEHSSKKPKIMMIGTRSNVAELVQKMRDPKPPARQPRFTFHEPAVRQDRAAESNSPHTFEKLLPLEFLPNSLGALQILKRLRDDLGVKAVMHKYKWTVPVLTELDPASNTQRDSKLLGLNRNHGQVIELRLRTDDYEGFRSYNSIRATLCHELTHNIYGEHNRDFWNFCKTLEREVIALDPFARQGNQLSNQEVYQPAEMEHEDGGGWIGGSFVLGGGDTSEPGQHQTTTEELLSMSERQLMYKTSRTQAMYEAAMKRKRQQQQDKEMKGNEAGPSQ